jgi:hypothetical protein
VLIDSSFVSQSVFQFSRGVMWELRRAATRASMIVFKSIFELNPVKVISPAIIDYPYDGLIKNLKRLLSVIPAQAGIQYSHAVRILWIPVFTGMTTFYESILIDYPLVRGVRALIVNSYIPSLEGEEFLIIPSPL